jgi:hypothetical protein
LFFFIFCAAPDFASAQNLSACSLIKTTTLPLAGDYGSFRTADGDASINSESDPSAPRADFGFVPSNATTQTKAPVVISRTVSAASISVFMKH